MADLPNGSCLNEKSPSSQHSDIAFADMNGIGEVDCTGIYLYYICIIFVLYLLLYICITVHLISNGPPAGACRRIKAHAGCS